ncbi:MAG TPA: flagellar brake domain-containing protein [Ureibacillus sp.]|nr:flagellar brake domain-containing protein [Ureibacillus sp.]
MQIKIGTALILEPTYTDEVEQFRCKIIEQENNILYIDYPVNTETNKTVFLIDGSQFRASFMTEDRVKYAFNTEVLGRKFGKIPTIELRCPPEEEIVKIQRREFVRVNTVVDVAIEYKNQFYQFVTEDISAGGLAIHLKDNFPIQNGETVQLTIVLPFLNGEIRYVQTSAKIVRIFEKNQLQLASLELIETNLIDKQYIVRFCFERQLMNRRKYEVNTL